MSALFALGLLLTVVGGATAAATVVPLGTAGNFAILAGTGVTNEPLSNITGDVGVSPTTGASMTGLSCAEVTGTIYSVDATPVLPCRVTDSALLGTAKDDLSTAFDNAAGQSPDTTYATTDNQLGGLNLVPGVYRFGHGDTANLIGNLTLTGDASSVWVFQATSDLVFAGSSTVTLSGGAQPCNVFWQVGSSATLGSSSSIVGTILALTSISLNSGATLQGRALAQNGLVTLDNNTITRPSSCAAAPVTTATTAETTTATTAETTTADTTTTATTTAATTTAAATTTTPAITTPAITTPAITTPAITTPATSTTPTATTPVPTAAAKAAAAKEAAAAKKAAASEAGFAKRARVRVALTG